ncbi:MAG: hypothetical protein ACLQU3_23820 [Limisphaerales bacterium]
MARQACHPPGKDARLYGRRERLPLQFGMAAVQVRSQRAID